MWGLVFDWTVRFSDVLTLGLGMILIPFARVVLTTLVEVRDAARELTLLVKGTGQGPNTGLIGAVAHLEEESMRHRRWLIAINAGLPPEDRIRMERT